MPLDDEKRRQAQQLLEASSIGWMFPIAIGTGALMGWGLDKLFGTKPWLTWIFLGFGIAAAFLNLFRAGLRNDDGSPPES
ncbi:MAG TPA: AtpZ/AtpI family protein [Thermoanaerobaculia bacterium]|nr:AtpZ/AtpI family protein [Thermoanaerobaculia bacterium]